MDFFQIFILTALQSWPLAIVVAAWLLTRNLE